MFHNEYNKFPLLDQVLVLLDYEDIMIRNSARNIFLSLLKMNYNPLIEYLCDIPRISIFIIIIQKIKSFILLMINLKNNNNNFYIEKTKELKEKIIEDLLFVQDILSVNNYKINYILINCLFSILFVYIFGKFISFNNNNNVKLKSEISKLINVLNIIFKNIKNENIKNLLCFFIYSDKVYSKLNKYLTKEENPEYKEYKMEILILINLNNLIFNYNFSRLEFEDYIILNYSQNFLKSIRYINKYDIKGNNIYNVLNEIYNNIIQKKEDENIKEIIQIISDKYIINKNNFIKKMYYYHQYISKITGVNCGICYSEGNDCFNNIIYNNFFKIQSNVINNNIINNYYQNNILRNKILVFLDNEIQNNNNINTIFNIILLLIQIIDDKDISIELKKLMNINQYNNNNKIIINKSNENNLLDLKELNIDNIKDNNNSFFQNITLSNNIIPEPVNKIDYSNLNDNNNSQYIIINNEKINFKEFNYDNDFFNKISSLFMNDNNVIIINIINFVFSTKFLLNNNKIILCFNLIENLINKDFQLNNNENSKKIIDMVDYYYLCTLKLIKDILVKNNDDLTNEIFKYSYSLFEECYNLNQKNIEEIINNYIYELQLSSYVILEKSDITEEKAQLKNLFQKFISLHDLRIMLKSNENNLLFKNMTFPLKIIKNDLFDIGGKIDLKKYEINPVEVNFNKNYINNNYISAFEELIMFIYNNYLFFALSPENIGSFDINYLDSEETSFIKYKYALRNIILQEKVDTYELLLFFIGNEKLAILLKFQNILLFNKGKELLINGINYSILLEYSSITSFINNNIGECNKNNK